MSLVLHNLRIFCRYSLTNFIQKSYCHTLEKVTLPPSIYKKLSYDPSEIFAYIEKNQEYLSGQHCVEALQKLQKSSMKFDDFNTIDFALLCNELKKRITTLDVSEAVMAVQALKILNVPSNSLIYESLLQIIRSNINSITIDEVIILQKVLYDIEKSPLTEAILFALPLIFDNQLPRIDKSNVYLLARCLVFATKLENKNINSISFIVNTLSECKNDVPVHAAKLICKSLSFVPNFTVDNIPFLKRMQFILIDNVSLLNFNDAMVILKSMYLPRTLKPFYNEYLVDVLVNSLVIEDDVGFNKGIEALEKLVKMRHEQIPLLDYVAMKFVEQSDYKITVPPKQLDVFVSAMSMSDYKPVLWDRIQELILSNKNIETYDNLTEFVFNLAVLDCYSSNLLKRVFEQNSQVEAMDSSKKRDILRFYQIVKTLPVGYEGPCPLKNNLDVLFEWEMFMLKEFPILKALEFVIGGSQFVETKVGTKFGHFIDHVIICDRETGLPVTISFKNGPRVEEWETCLQKPITFIENIIVPENCQVLLFIDIPIEGYTINTMQLRGFWIMIIKTLEAMNYSVIPICSKKWLRLNEKEKIPYLMQAMKLKCNVNLNPL